MDALALRVSAAVSAVRASSALNKAVSSQLGSRATGIAVSSPDSKSAAGQSEQGGESIETQLLRMLTSPDLQKQQNTDTRNVLPDAIDQDEEAPLCSPPRAEEVSSDDEMQPGVADVRGAREVG